MAQDVYAKWLGLPPGPRPPDHYTLLGLPPRCDDLRRIEAAARVQTAKLQQKRQQAGAIRQQASVHLIRQVAQARGVLLDPILKKAYDQQLRQQQPAATGQPSQTDDDPIQQILADVHGKPMLEDTLPDLFPRNNTFRMTPLHWAGVGLAGVLLTGLVLWLALGTGGHADAPDERWNVAADRPAAVDQRLLGQSFTDDFTRNELRVEYRPINTPPQALDLQGDRLVLVGVDHQPVRVDLLPPQQQMFEEATIRLLVHRDCEVTLGIIQAAHMILQRHGDEVHIQVIPGYPGMQPMGNPEQAQHDWPRIRLNDQPDGLLEVRLRRRRDTITWAINDRIVATSPDLRLLGSPGLSIQTTGPVGPRAAVDHIHIWYASTSR